MREILFRGKRVDNGEWVYGAYYKQEYVYGDEKVAHCIITTKDVLSNDLWLDYEEVIPETVGQFTGLTDKNGKKIFEGDIVDILTENEERGVITYNDGCFIVEADGFIITFIDHLYGTDVEVIGNIHDNHELLKGEEE